MEDSKLNDFFNETTRKLLLPLALSVLILSGVSATALAADDETSKNSTAIISQTHKAPKEDLRIGLFENVLAQLLNENIISQEKAAELNNFFNDLQAEHEAEKAAFENMSDAEREAYIAKNIENNQSKPLSTESEGMFQQFVDAGILTQGEADIASQYLAANFQDVAEKNQHIRHLHDRELATEEVLRQYYAQGMISQEIIEDILSCRDAQKAEFLNRQNKLISD